jgi:hypothetical protein
MGIQWDEGMPPETQRCKRMLLIALPANVNFDIAADNRPDICVGHFHRAGNPNPVPARYPGATGNHPRPKLLVLYWAEMDLPPDVELRELTYIDLEG